MGAELPKVVMPRNIECSLPFEDGFPENIFRTVSAVSNLQCPICLNIVREPMSDNCKPAHTFCLGCIQRVQNGKCPLAPGTQLGALKLNTNAKKLLEKQKVRCYYEDEGCAFNETLAKFMMHIYKECEYRRVECPHSKCYRSMPYKELQYHADECDYRQLECPNMFCTKKLEKHSLNEHLSRCQFRRVDCPNKCGAQVFFKESQQHTSTECPMEPVPCPFYLMLRDSVKESGLEKLAEAQSCLKVPRGKVKEHCAGSFQEHSTMLLKLCGRTVADLQELNKTITEAEQAKSHFTMMQEKVEELKKTFNERDNDYEQAQADLSAIKQRLLVLESAPNSQSAACTCSLI